MGVLTHHAAVAVRRTPPVLDGYVATCPIIDLDVFCGARSRADYEEILVERGVLASPSGRDALLEVPPRTSRCTLPPVARGILIAAVLSVLLTACGTNVAQSPGTTRAPNMAITAAPSVTAAMPSECGSALRLHDDLTADLAAALNHYVAGIDASQYGALEGRYGTVMSRFRQVEAQWAAVRENCPSDRRSSASVRWRAASQKISELRAVCRAGPGPDLGWTC